MSQVIQNQPATVPVVLSNSTSGEPLAGVTAAEITMYVKKEGAASVSKTITTDNFSEVDATNMPGLYEITFTHEDLSTVGTFIAVIQAGTSTNGNFDQVALNLTVASSDNAEQNPRGSLIAWRGRDNHITIPMRSKNGPFVENGASELRGSIPWYCVDLTVTKSDGTVVKYDSDSSDTWYWSSDANWGAGAFKEIDQTNAPGHVALKLNATDHLQSVGDLSVKVEANGNYAWDVYAQDLGGDFFVDMAFIDTNEGYGVGPNGVITHTTDSGVTWTETAGSRITSEYLRGVSVVDNAGTWETWVGGNFNSTTSKHTLVYYDGTTWNNLEPDDTDLGYFINGYDFIETQALGPNDIWIFARQTGGQYTLGYHYTGGVSGTWTAPFENTGLTTLNDAAVFGSPGSAIAITVHDGGTIRRFTQGGAAAGSTVTFSGASPTKDLGFVHFVNDTHGWIISKDGSEIWGTTDGGAVWSKAYDDPDSSLSKMNMVDENFGIAHTFDGVLITEDGGINWEFSPTFHKINDGSNAKGAIAALSKENIIYSSNNRSVRWREAPLFHTRTMHVQVLEDILGSNYDEQKHSLQRLRFMMDSTLESLPISSEITAGETASLSTRFIDEDTLDPLTSLEGHQVKMQALKGGAVDPSIELLSFAEIDSSSLPGHYRFQISSEVTTEPGNYVLIFDRPLDWVRFKWDAAVTGEVIDVDTSSQNSSSSDLRFVGDNGVFIDRTNGNWSFEIIDSSTTDLNAVSGVDNDFVYVSSTGSPGKLFIKTDYAAGSWVEVTDSGMGFIYDLLARNESGNQVALTVGDEIRKYNHNTTTWTTMTTPNPAETFFRALSVTAKSSTELFASGVDRTMFYSSDGGATWSEISTPLEPHLFSGADIEHVNYMDNGELWALSGTAILRSTDDGASWESWSTYDFHELGFWDEWDEPNLFTSTYNINGDGYVRLYGSSVAILKTNDGGQTWEKESVPEDSEGWGSEILAVGRDIAAGAVEDSNYDIDNYLQFTGSPPVKSYSIRIRVSPPPSKSTSWQ